MKRFELCLSLLALLLVLKPSLGLDWSSLVWIGGRQVEEEKPEVVEVVRWRQPVCVIPAKGVKSCLRGLSNLQKDYERANVDEFGDTERKEIEESSLKRKQRRSKDYVDVSRDASNPLADSNPRFATYELFGQVGASEEDLAYPENKDDSVGRRTIPLQEKLPLLEENPREGKYLTVSGKKRNLIYVTKVLNAPVTATLLALECLPDIGIPLCDEDRSFRNIQLYEDKVKERKEKEGPKTASEVEAESKKDDANGEKLLEIFAKQRSFENVARRMMEKAEESGSAVGKAGNVESSKKFILNLKENAEQFEKLDRLTEILLKKSTNESDHSNREKRNANLFVFDKYNGIFPKLTARNSVYVVENPLQSSYRKMIRKYYDVFDKPIYVYRKQFEHTNVYDWLFSKKPAEKSNHMQNLFQHFRKRKFLSFDNESVPLINEKLESHISYEKSRNFEDATAENKTNRVVDRSNVKPVDGTSTGGSILANPQE